MMREEDKCGWGKGFISERAGVDCGLVATAKITASWGLLQTAQIEHSQQHFFLLLALPDERRTSKSEAGPCRIRALSLAGEANNLALTSIEQAGATKI